MDASELEAAFRQRADDRVEPYLYSQEEVFRWASEAEVEACARARLIYDSTSSFLAIPIVAEQSDYTLDARIDRIDSARFTPTGSGRSFPVELVGIDDIRSHHDWQNRRGRPEQAARIGRVLKLWPRPSEAGTLNLDAYRFPLFPMEDDSDEPEIPLEAQPDLVWWMLVLAYTTKDGETEDSPRVASSAALFAARFGERPSADVLRRHREKRRVTTTYGGY